MIEKSDLFLAFEDWSALRDSPFAGSAIRSKGNA